MTAPLRILLFARLAEIAETSELHIELDKPVTAARLRQHVASACPALAPHLESAVIAVNHRYAAPKTSITPDDEVALIPPVSGG